MKKIILIVIFLIIVVFFFFFWQRIEETVKTWEEIEEKEIVLKEEIEEKTVEEIVEQLALFDNKNYYLEDLNRDGFLEVVIISLSPEMNTAHFVLISLIDKKGDYQERGSLILEKDFSAIPFIEETRDIKNNHVQEIVVDLQAGGVATQTHALLEWEGGLRLVTLIDQEGEERDAIFLIGASAMHHQLYYIEEETIVEINAWRELEEEINCIVNAYRLKDYFFIYDSERSAEMLEKAGDDCLIENDQL